MAKNNKIQPGALVGADRMGYTTGVTEQPDDFDEYEDMSVDVSGEEGFEEDEVPHAEGEGEENEFDANLADKLSESEQIALGIKLREYVEVDLDSRRKWELRMLDGLEVIGLEDVPADAVAFEGAARVTYPGIAEAMIQFQARAMEELMPPEGPVKAGVMGKSNDQLEQQAERVQDYMNYQLMEEDDEYYWETDDLLLYLPYAGSAFKKVAIDPLTKRTRSRFVPASDFIVPYWTKSLQTSARYTHRYSMPRNVFKQAVASGYFVDADFPVGQANTDDFESKKIQDASDDRVESMHEDDQDLHLYEMTIDQGFEWETFGKDCEYDLPYAITFEWETGRVVRIARQWQETDATCRRDVWFSHYKFLPGLGFYGWGYLHLIGGLGKAAAGALRLLLDGSATASLQGGFKSRDARIAGDIDFSPATWQDVDMTAEELSKSFYSPPFKEPSPALFKTLEILINGIQRFASTTEAMVGDASNTGPVGTTVALIEQGSKIFSGIHKRLHAAARREFKLIAKSNYRFMEMDEYPYDVEGGDKRVLREDFSPKIDIIPVSDPNIFSSVQRIALAQAGVQMVDSRPDLYPKPAAIRAHRAMWKALRIPDWEKYLPEKQVQRMDPVSENESILNGGGVQVFREQDDAAHLAVHTAFQQEIMGMDPEIQQKALPALLAHKASHFAQAYRKRLEQQMLAQTGVPLPPFDPNNPDDNEELPPDIENAVAIAAAQYAPPPPPPQSDAEGEAKASREDMLATRKADRDDMLAKRQADREDAQRLAEAQRDGLISDV